MDVCVVCVVQYKEKKQGQYGQKDHARKVKIVKRRTVLKER
jgi:hypothetical protein